MGRLIKILVGIVVGFAALMLLSGLAIRMMLSGSARQTLLSTLESRLHAPVSIEGGDFDLVQWFKFTPSITLRKFSVGNPQGFSDAKAIEAEEVSAQVALMSLFSDRIEVHSIVLRKPQLQVENNAQGQSNLGVLFSSSSPAEGTPAPPTEGKATSLAIHGLSLVDGTIRYLEAGNAQPLSIEDIDLRLTNFTPDSSCQIDLSSRLFGGDHCTLKFKGTAGPFGDKSIPAKGHLDWELAPAEVPPAIRQKYFGNVLADVPGNSRVKLASDVDGDIFTALKGKGELTLENLEVGPENSRLPLAGKAPLDLTVQRPLGDPAISLATPGASLTLGSGVWKGNTQFQFANSRLKGSINGAISGVDMNQFLSAFTESRDKVFGTAQMPDFALSFNGSGSEQIVNSLSGKGNLTLENGRIAALDVFNTVTSQVEKMLSAEVPAAGQTEFVRFVTAWQIGGQRLDLSNMQLDSGKSALSGQGSIGFDHQIAFDLRTTITGVLATKLGGKPNSAGVAATSIPVKVSGTIEAPRVKPDIKQVATEQIKERVGGLLDSLFKKKN